MGGFSIWHWIILLAVISIPVVAVFLIVVLVNRSNKPPAATGAAPPPIGQSIEARLRDLDALRARGVVTDAEYAERRAAILGSL